MTSDMLEGKLQSDMPLEYATLHSVANYSDIAKRENFLQLFDR
jgi:hypothetical protein